MNNIELRERYPLSRAEDVTDAYMRGFEAGRAMVRGTCHKLPADNGDMTCTVRNRGFEMEFGYWRCSECGCNCFEGARYCMGCGREAVDDEP